MLGQIVIMGGQVCDLGIAGPSHAKTNRSFSWRAHRLNPSRCWRPPRLEWLKEAVPKIKVPMCTISQTATITFRSLLALLTLKILVINPAFCRVFRLRRGCRFWPALACPVGVGTVDARWGPSTRLAKSFKILVSPQSSTKQLPSASRAGPPRAANAN